MITSIEVSTLPWAAMSPDGVFLDYREAEFWGLKNQDVIGKNLKDFIGAEEWAIIRDRLLERGQMHHDSCQVINGKEYLIRNRFTWRDGLIDGQTLGADILSPGRCSAISVSSKNLEFLSWLHKEDEERKKRWPDLPHNNFMVRLVGDTLVLTAQDKKMINFYGLDNKIQEIFSSLTWVQAIQVRRVWEDGRAVIASESVRSKQWSVEQMPQIINGTYNSRLLNNPLFLAAIGPIWHRATVIIHSNRPEDDYECLDVIPYRGIWDRINPQMRPGKRLGELEDALRNPIHDLLIQARSLGPAQADYFHQWSDPVWDGPNEWSFFKTAQDFPELGETYTVLWDGGDPDTRLRQERHWRDRQKVLERIG